MNDDDNKEEALEVLNEGGVVESEPVSDIAHLSNMVSSAANMYKISAEAEIQMKNKLIDANVDLTKKLLPVAYILLISLILLVGYLLVYKDDTDSVMTIFGFIATVILSWIAGNERGKHQLK